MHIKLVSPGQKSFPPNTGFSYAQILLKTVFTVQDISPYKISGV